MKRSGFEKIFKQKIKSIFVSLTILTLVASFYVHIEKIQAAADVIIAIGSATSSPGSDFSVDVTINPLDHSVTNADLRITYDDTKFTLTSITPSTMFPNVLSPADVVTGEPIVPSPADGTGFYSASTVFTGPNRFITSTQIFATLNFHAVALATNSPITMVLNGTNPTAVFADNSVTYPADSGNNVAGTFSNGSVNIDVVDLTGPTFTNNRPIIGTVLVPIQAEILNISVADATGVASQFYGFSADSTCDASDTINTSFLNEPNPSTPNSANDFSIMGNHNGDYLCLKATDTSPAANVSYSNPAIGRIYTDNTAPIVTLTSPSPSAHVNGSELVTASANDVVELWCSLDNSNWDICYSGSTILSDSTDWASLPEGAFIFYVSGTDVAGNVSNLNQINLVKDVSAPVEGSFTINGGAAIASSSDVTLNVTCANDIFGSVQVSFGNSANPSTNWKNCVSSMAYSLPSGDGLKTVYARFRDLAGNVTSSDVSSSITLTDTTAPVISNGTPSGTLDVGTTQTTVALNTNENAICKYSTTAGVQYSAMTDTFTTTGGTTSSFVAGGLMNGTTYAYYIKCQDNATNQNVNASDYIISFGVAIPPVVEESSHSKDKPAPPRHIRSSKIIVKRGSTMTQRGNKFSKRSTILLYFSKYGGGYYAPKTIKTSKSGSFVIKYKVQMTKKVGTYYWYVVDTKTKKKSSVKYYRVR